MTKLGKLIIVVLPLVAFALGYGARHINKPMLPDPGTIEVATLWSDEHGTMYCFDEESYENLGVMMLGLSKQFKGYEGEDE